MADVVLPEQIRIDRWIKRKMHNIDLTLVMVCYDYEGVCGDTSELDFAYVGLPRHPRPRSPIKSEENRKQSQTRRLRYSCYPAWRSRVELVKIYPHKTFSQSRKIVTTAARDTGTKTKPGALPSEHGEMHSRYDKLHGEDSLCCAIVELFKAIAKIRMKAEYGDYLAYACANLKIERMNDLAWKIDRLDWQEVAERIEMEEAAKVEQEARRIALFPTPYLDDVAV
ncbi:hypothetical protein BDR22DRAFT_918691 [Usnea florida]